MQGNMSLLGYTLMKCLPLMTCQLSLAYVARKYKLTIKQSSQ